MKKYLYSIIAVLMLSLVISFTGTAFAEAETPKMTREQAKTLTLFMFQVISKNDAKTSGDVINSVMPAIEEATKLYPDEHFSWYVLYLCYISKMQEEKGYRDKAIGAIGQAYQLQPNEILYVLTYGQSLKALQWKVKESRDLFADYSKRNGKPLSLELAVGITSSLMQDYEVALPILLSSLDRVDKESSNPKQDRSIFLSEIGNVYNHLGEYEKSISYLTESIKLLSTNLVAKARFAEAKMKTGKVSEGLTLLEEVLKKNPQSGEFHYLKGLALELTGKTTEARASFEKAYSYLKEGIKTSDDDGREHFLMAQCCLKLGLKDEAQLYLNNAKQLLYTYEPPFRS